MMTATNTRKEARESLKGKWVKAVLIFLAYGVILYLIQLVLKTIEKNNELLYLILSIGEIIISVPILYGFVIAFMKLKRGEEVNSFDFLTLGFSNFKRSWDVAWNEFLVIVVPFLIMLVILFVVSGYLVYSSGLIMSSSSFKYIITSNYIVFVISLIAIMACTIWSIVKRYSIALAKYIAYDEPGLSGKEAVKKSKQLIQGNKGNLFVLELSFIGWAILAILTLGIGYLWLMPYINVSQICFYEELKNKNKLEQKIES